MFFLKISSLKINNIYFYIILFIYLYFNNRFNFFYTFKTARRLTESIFYIIRLYGLIFFSRFRALTI